jgi:hypothetical protein
MIPSLGLGKENDKRAQCKYRSGHWADFRAKGGAALSELDEDWTRALAEAERRAREAGRGDIVDYLALKASNDLARKTAVNWLLEVFTAKVADLNRCGSSIQIKRADNHNFRAGVNTMVGTLLTFKSGVRSLMVEAGWPRSPRDGIVKGGGLAQGQIRHFGRKALDHELLLVRSRSGAPEWVVINKEGDRLALAEAVVEKHVRVFAG